MLTKSPKNNKLTSQPLSVVNLVPQRGTLIEPGQKQKMVATFSQAISVNDVIISLSETDSGLDRFHPIGFTSEASGNKLSITFSELVQQNYLYKITFTDKQTGVLLSQAAYLTMQPQPTKTLDNNLSLKQYLPQSTDSYELYYSQPLNVYIFYFIYDPKSALSLTAQREKAASDMNQFVQSKAIDLSTIKIKYLN